MKNQLSLTAWLLVIALGLVGCGQSKEDAALARIRNRPKPGYLRVLNLMDKPVKAMWTTLTLDPNIKAMGVSPFRPVGTGKKTIQLFSGETEIASLEVDVPSEDAVTLIVFEQDGKIQHKETQGDLRNPNPGQNLQAQFIHLGTGKPEGKVTLSSGGNNYTFEPTTAPMVASTGEYTVSGVGIDHPMGGPIESDGAYTVMVVTMPDGKTHAMLLRNTSTDKPAAGGMAAT